MFGITRVVKRIEQEKSLDQISQPLAEAVTKATSPDKVKYFLSGSWLGHQLHPMASDIPIGAWTMASVLDMTGGKEMRSAAQRLVALGVLSSFPVAASGASDWAESYGKEQRVGVVHAIANSAGTVMQVLSWMARRKDRHKLGACLSLTGLGFTTAAGYLGGHLSFVQGVGVNHTAFQQTSRDWVEVAQEDEIAEGQLVRVTAKNTPVLLTRHRGQLHALSATCSHAGGPLHNGHIENDCVVCPWHHSKFRLSDGKPTRGPAGSGQPVWDVRSDNGRISVKAAQ